VSDLFPEPLDVSRASLVILTARGNPREIRRLEDLARPGLRVGVANPEQSALGDLTVKVLDQLQLRERVLSNVKVQTPTADLLVNQMRAGGLDAAVVYTVSVSQAKDDLTVVPIEAAGAEAVQPYAVRKGSRHRRLMERLLRSILSPESRELREALGFHSCPVGE
jgi:molybdate transport system substrate-binding protein